MKQNTRRLVVSRPRDLSPHWAQSIVDQHVERVNVFAVNLRSIDIGTSTRLRIDVEHDAGPRIPRRWFVKTPSLAFKPRLITTLPRFLHKEVSFYRSLSAQMPVRLPSVLAAESFLGRGSTLVLGDLTESNFKPGMAGEALSAEQAGQVVENLAKLHSRYQNDGKLLLAQHWLQGFSYDIENHMGSLLAVPLMKQGLRTAGELIAGKLHSSALTYAANRKHIKRVLAAGPQTLVHYDCHPGNLFWNGSEPGFLDWQLVRMGEGIGDVAYFLATALQPEIRRHHEQQLIARYAAHLSTNGLRDVDEQTLFRRYRKHLVYPFEAMVITLAIGDMMDRNSNIEMIKRAAAAVEDHDSFARVGF